MSEHECELTFLRYVILYDDTAESRKLEDDIAQVQRNRRCVQRAASWTSLVALLAFVGVAYGDILQENFPHNGSELVFRLLCELILASLICLLAFATLLIGYHLKMIGLRQECRRLLSKVLEARLGKPQISALPGGSHPRSPDVEAFPSPAEVRSYT